MRPKVDPIADAPGQDSFSDVVTNLVAVLIIMVTVVGVRAKDALLDAAPDSVETPRDRAAEVDSAANAMRAVESDIHSLANTMGRQRIEIAYRKEERDRVQLLVASARDAIEQRRGTMDASQQAEFDVQKNLIAARGELEELDRATQALATNQPPPSIIEHLPTPMARTVFGKELHFRLKDSRLVYVPWDELVRQLKDEAPHKVWRLKEESEFTETLGPAGGFWMQYTLKRTEVTIPTKMGANVQTRVELDRFILLPVTEDFGEPLTVAMAEGSQFRTILEQHRPTETTVTVWVYPDSYGQFRDLKQTLYRMGYLTASRPMPDGHPIGGSPQGTRSASE